MKFRMMRQQVAGTYTRDGKTIPVSRTVQTRIPVLPRDWQTIALGSAIAIVIGLTLISITWSTWSIGSLLGGGIGFLVGVIFDIAWAVSLLLEYLARYDERKRAFPTRLGWLLLVITMIAIGWDGLLRGSVPMAVVGALVSFFAKILWMAVMKHVHAQLSEEDKQWVAQEISQAQAKAAIASIRRQTARTEQRAALELLAIEKEKRDVAEAFGIELESSETIAPARVALELTMPTLSDMAKSDAIRFVHNQKPSLTATEVSELLADHEVDAPATYVQQVINRDKAYKANVETAPEAEIIEMRK
jgi:hypothetical protein